MTPPDQLSPFERLKLFWRQGLDFDRATVGQLLAEIEQLKALDAELEQLKARLRDSGVAFLEREACAGVAMGYAVLPTGFGNPATSIAAAIRGRGDTEGREK